VALEPTRQRLVVRARHARAIPDTNVLLTYDNQLLGSEPLTEPVSFDAVSYTRTRALEPLGAFGRQQDTAPLPRGMNPRSVALAQTLRQRAGFRCRLRAGDSGYLRTGGFEYTLTPEPLGADRWTTLCSIRRAGFCGHYASAFVTLMRAADVPARVVTGYLGGEWNPIAATSWCAKRTAHAWAEVWLEGRGWTRIDPTAVVAPERLRRGVFDLLPDALATPSGCCAAPPGSRGCCSDGMPPTPGGAIAS